MNRGRDVQGRIGSFYDDDHDYALYIKAEASKYHQFIIMLFPQEAHNWQAHNAAPSSSASVVLDGIPTYHLCIADKQC